MTALKAWIMSWVIALFPALDPDLPPSYAGYVEAEYVYVAPTATRELLSLEVAEGDEVKEGQALFELEDTREAAALRAVIARHDAAVADLTNLETGSRSAEIEVVRASLEQAQADQSLARTNLSRSESLHERGIVTTARVDADHAALERANARVAQLRAQLDVAELPARDAQIVAARAAVSAAQAEIDSARAALADLRVSAPAAGRIETVYFDPGEVAVAGKPVLSILPEGRMKVLFYIPEPERQSFALGERLVLDCDGCSDGLSIKITRMASEPQFTPPIIYSRDERTRLVFRAEGLLSQGAGLFPGQPVTLERTP